MRKLLLVLFVLFGSVIACDDLPTVPMPPPPRETARAEGCRQALDMMTHPARFNPSDPTAVEMQGRLLWNRLDCTNLGKKHRS